MPRKAKSFERHFSFRISSQETKYIKGYSAIIGCFESDLMHILIELADWDRVKSVGLERFKGRRDALMALAEDVGG